MIVRIYTGDDGQTHFEDLPLPAEENHNVATKLAGPPRFRWLGRPAELDRIVTGRL